uniref:Uncharacterized protein n=1 Tax=Oryza rufipogon TaxID=4529 RepID=A0A0E0MQD8_ORYRU
MDGKTKKGTETDTWSRKKQQSSSRMRGGHGWQHGDPDAVQHCRQHDTHDHDNCWLLLRVTPSVKTSKKKQISLAWQLAVL